MGGIASIVSINMRGPHHVLASEAIRFARERKVTATRPGCENRCRRVPMSNQQALEVHQRYASLQRVDIGERSPWLSLPGDFHRRAR